MVTLSRPTSFYRVKITARFYLSFLDDNPRPDAAVIQALNDGAGHIVVSEVFLTISSHTFEGEELIREVGVEEYGAALASIPCHRPHLRG